MNTGIKFSGIFVISLVGIIFILDNFQNHFVISLVLSMIITYLFMRSEYEL